MMDNKNTPIPRLFSEITYEKEEKKQSEKLEVFFNHKIIVVLGEPGLGKTTSFKEGAKLESNAEYLTVGSFLNVTKKEWSNKTLYLDGLDEYRAGTETGLNSIISKLDTLNPPKTRISCRAADWHSKSDIEALKDIDNDIVTLELKPLDEDDIKKIVSQRLDDIDGFLKGAEEHDLLYLFENPQILDLFITVYNEKHTWVNSRKELLEQAIESLLKESNETHSRKTDDNVLEQELKTAADYLATISILSNVEGLALTKQASSTDYPALTEICFSDDLKILKTTARRLVFTQTAPEIIKPKHRMITEYMTARYLAEKIKNGLPINRVLTLITGFDGGALSDLRGVYAWLVTLLSQDKAEQILDNDPYGAIIYGDTSTWAVTTKKAVLKSLEKLTKKDPWFNKSYHNYEKFAGLACEELVEDFRNILKESKSNHLKAVVLNALEKGKPLPELGDDLLDFVKDETNQSCQALRIFSKLCPNRTDDLLQIINNLKSDNLSSPQEQIYGKILELLYPQIITPKQITDYLLPINDDRVNSNYLFFISYGILEKTPPEDLPVLADILSEEHILKGDRRYERFFSDFSIKLIELLIKDHRELITAERFYSWLGIGLRENGSQFFNFKKNDTIKTFIKELYIDMLRNWLKTPKTDLSNEWWKFKKRLLHTFPKGISFDLLKIASETTDEETALLLFHEAMSYSWDSKGQEVTLDNLYDFAESKPMFLKCLEQNLSRERPERTKKFIESKAQFEKTEELQRKTNIKNLEKNIAQICAGVDINSLYFFTRKYLSSRANSIKDFKKYLEKEFNLSIANAAFEGFQNILKRDDLPSPYNIGKAVVEKKEYGIMYYPVLTGMDIIADIGFNVLLQLSDKTLASILCMYKVHSFKTSEWFERLMNERPELAAKALFEFWKPQLSNIDETPNGLYGLQGNETIAKIASIYALKLLKEFPSPNYSALISLLRIALLNCSHNDFQTLITEILSSKKALNKKNTALWVSAGFLLRPQDFNEQLVSLIEEDKDNAWIFLAFISDSYWREAIVSSKLKAKHIRYLLPALLQKFDNVPRSEEARWIGSHDPEDTSSFIRDLIASLANDTSEETSNLFSEMIADNKLHQWRDVLKNLSIEQTKKRREKEFSYNTIDEVMKVLQNAAPANIRDLKALVVDHLYETSKQIKCGNTDTWKAFWNTDSYGKVTSPKTEPLCRDRLLELLKSKLEKHRITAVREEEVHNQKKPDISILFDNMMLPIEAKRQNHHELWSAMFDQLITQYTIDPRAKGHGVYLVFWQNNKGIPKPPEGIQKPSFPEELKEALETLLDDKQKQHISIVVIDCSKP